jgi:hypothetical protein
LALRDDDAFRRILAEAPSIGDRLDRLSRLEADEREAIAAEIPMLDDSPPDGSACREREHGRDRIPRVRRQSPARAAAPTIQQAAV